uniref:Uncharacterized protein n=1 Tax=Anopheles atroparvus TaxID=41427 RepID=A0A182IMU2_ANOAO
MTAVSLPPFGLRLKKSRNISASTVADETMMRSWGRFRAIFFSSPSAVSVSVLRSCASSSMITPYWVRSGSASISRSRMPSVMYLIFVRSGSHRDTKRIDTPTVSPHSSPRSVATRSASVIADIRRGSRLVDEGLHAEQVHLGDADDDEQRDVAGVLDRPQVLPQFITEDAEQQKVEQRVHVEDAPEPGNAEETGGAKHRLLVQVLGRRDVLALQHVLVDGDVAVPAGRAEHQHAGVEQHLPGDLLRRHLHLVDDARLAAALRLRHRDDRLELGVAAPGRIVLEEHERADHERDAPEPVADAVDVVPGRPNVRPLAADVLLRARHVPIEIVEEGAELEQHHADAPVAERVGRHHAAGRDRHEHVKHGDHVRRHQVALGETGQIVHDRGDRREQHERLVVLEGVQDLIAVLAYREAFALRG